MPAAFCPSISHACDSLLEAGSFDLRWQRNFSKHDSGIRDILLASTIHQMPLAKRLRHLITRDIFARRDICALATFSHGAAEVFQVLIAKLGISNSSMNGGALI
jgi:hypothetical protein